MSVKPLRFGELIDRPVRLVRDNFKPLFTIGIIGYGAGVVPGIFLNARMQTWQDTTSPEQILGELGGMLLFVGVATIAMGGAMLAMYAAAAEVVRGRPFTVGGCWRQAFTLGPWTTSFIWMVGMVAVSVPTCGLGGLLLMVMWALAIPVGFQEDRWNVEALKRSWRLCAHKPMPGHTSPALLVAGITLVYYLLAMAIAGVNAIPAMIWGVMAGVEAASSGSELGIAMPPWLNVSSSVFGAVSNTVAGLYLAMATNLLYKELVERRDGEGIAGMLADRLGDDG